MKKRANRNEAIEAIKRLDDFKSHTGNFRGIWNLDGVYEVWSYGVVIGQCNGRTWNVSDRKYSVTTSRHQSFLRRAVAAMAVSA